MYRLFFFKGWQIKVTMTKVIIRVIVLADCADSRDGLLVLVRLVGVDVVQGLGGAWVPVRARKVYTNLQYRVRVIKNVSQKNHNIYPLIVT